MGGPAEREAPRPSLAGRDPRGVRRRRGPGRNRRRAGRRGLVRGPDGEKLGRLEPETGKVEWTPLPDGPVAVSAAADGAVWVVLGIGDKLGRIAPKG